MIALHEVRVAPLHASILSLVLAHSVASIRGESYLHDQVQAFRAQVVMCWLGGKIEDRGEEG